eukprot:6211391-Pleurochrysis_carterae.AAC.1
MACACYLPARQLEERAGLLSMILLVPNHNGPTRTSKWTYAYIRTDLCIHQNGHAHSSEWTYAYIRTRVMHANAHILESARASRAAGRLLGASISDRGDGGNGDGGDGDGHDGGGGGGGGGDGVGD